MTVMTQEKHARHESRRPSRPEATNATHIEAPFMATKAFPFFEVRFRLDKHQGRTLRAIHDALLQQGAKLKDGHIVDGPHDAVRWLLEQAEKGIPAGVLDAA